MLKQANKLALQNELDQFINTRLPQNSTIILASDTGSHSKGYDTPTSDYDIKILYMQPNANYLTPYKIPEQHDNSKDKTNCDIVAWDITKFLRLLQQSNPTCIEWLSSTVITEQNDTYLKPIKSLALQCLNYNTLAHAYTGMYNQTVQKYNPTNIKAQLKQIHAIAMLNYCIHENNFKNPKTLPPIHFNNIITLPKHIYDYTFKLRHLRETQESQTEPLPTEIQNWFTKQLDTYQETVWQTKTAPDNKQITKMFQNLLNKQLMQNSIR